MLKLLIVFLFVFLPISQAGDLRNCTSCHNIEKIDSVHKLSCIDCHVLKKNKDNISSHKVIIKNPSSFEYVDMQCGKCHKQDIEILKNSLHGSLSSCINITRSVWHAQKTPKPVFGISKTDKLKAIPHSKKSINKPADLVDDMLRRKCLRCHLENNTYPTVGAYRAKGCAACHMEYDKFGKYKGKDAIVQGRVGYSKIHKFYKHPKISSCLACHNNEFVGSDFVGLFPQDYDKAFRSPILKSGYFKMRQFGVGQHHLSLDIHFKRGLTCIDCHKKKGVMGDGKIYDEELKAVKVKCSSCHGGYNTKPDNNFVDNTKEGYRFISSSEKVYYPKQFNKKILAHKYHSRVSCSACHSSWQYGNFQLNLYLDKTKNYKMWKNLIYQEDAYLETFLKKALKHPNMKPLMPDYVDKKLKEGIWYSGWLARRWSYFTLIVSDDGYYRTARPIFQFRLTYKDKNGSIIFDDVDNMSVMIPYVPHTVSVYGKSCEACHDNEFIIDSEQFKDTAVGEFFTAKVLFGKKSDADWTQSNKFKTVRFKTLQECLNKNQQ